MNQNDIDKKSKRGYISQSDAKKYKKYLKVLTVNVGNCLRAIDMTMKRTESVERGKLIAKICNVLEMANDQARYFGLNIDFRTDKKDTTDPPDLLWCLKEIMEELPTKRDWLNPDLEKIIKKTIKKAETRR